MARKIKERIIKSPRITIIGEGLTERCYFTHLRKLKGYRYICKPRNFADQSLDEMQKQVERVLADDGVAVCVFDADVARGNAAEREKLERFYARYREARNVVICDSMPSIEFWFLLHYLHTSRHFNTSEDVVAMLRKYLPDFSKHEKFLMQERWVHELISEHRLEKACERAVSIGKEGASYSNIYKAIRLFEQEDNL
jgi:hypothetical protein